jgi:hypothetical protein
LVVAQEKAVQKRVERIIDELEGMVDPFDLDVFTPYMKNHLTRQTQRCHVSSRLCLGPV